ncbi:hypothetical protein DCAR_0311313 [Daucus carota subsp. sativus]|uniref:Replication protein A 70 kDa DNA-binding subunit B/D first OB fold domain-containing protein n=1 Tax=Daucus carota subsp. sativus TaxID=79200 RepID=A0AAF1ATQ0_DAUCS|nr:hypothetical protein DCAR_0311313 [Daucus carota subsp. sativus]
MASSQYTTIDKLKTRVDTYRITVRVIRLSRGSTKEGEEFKSFNIVLIDQKGQRIHAFVPTKCAEEFQYQLYLGKMFSIKNFDVQHYKQTDKFRFLRKDTQLVFSKETKIQELPDDGVTIPVDGFDFYDLSQLEELTKQTTYLSDVVGIIKDYDNIRDLRNKHGKDQRQAKFIITDGSSQVNVTFWDKFGQIDISNNNATRIYLNYKHHSVTQLRKLLKNPDFAKRVLGKAKVKPMVMATVEALGNMGKEVVEDNSGQMQVILGDREVRTITGRRASDLAHEAIWFMQTCRCFQNDVFIQLYHMTELFVAEGVDYIQRHVFHFTDLSAIMDLARKQLSNRNKYNQLKYNIELTINDMLFVVIFYITSAQVIFYDEMAQSFDQEVHNAGQHPVIVIISSVKARLIQGEAKLTNYSPTRFFINLNHEAVRDLRDAFRLANFKSLESYRLANWRLH